MLRGAIGTQRAITNLSTLRTGRRETKKHECPHFLIGVHAGELVVVGGGGGGEGGRRKGEEGGGEKRRRREEEKKGGSSL